MFNSEKKDMNDPQLQESQISEIKNESRQQNLFEKELKMEKKSSEKKKK